MSKENPVIQEAPVAAPSERSSYGTILKSTSILGGSQAVVYLIGMLRTKVVAMLLGTSGVGLIGIYSSIVTLANAISNMGLTNSGVREIANARGKGDARLVAEVSVSIFRIAIALGLIGALILACLAPFVSRWLFGSDEYSFSISIVGSILFFNGINVAQLAVIQGYRRISSLARMSIISAIASTLIALALYFPLREKGIVPALIVISILNVAVAWHYSRQIVKDSAPVSWSRTWLHSKRLLTIGAAVAWGLLLAEVVPFYAKSLIVREMGVEANGLYVAAFAVSGLFVGFVLNAMSADYFPRLSEVVEDVPKRNRLVNEQTEIGVLIVLPCILGAFTFAPLVIQLLYSESFLEASVLLRWFLLGVFARVINWPLGMIMLARGDSRIFASAQTFTAGLHCVWITVLFSKYGLEGAAMAFGLHNLLVTMIYALGGNLLYDFKWSRAVLHLFVSAGLALVVIAAISLSFEGYSGYVMNGLIVFGVGLFCLKGLASRMRGHAKMNALIECLPKWVNI